MLKKSKKSEKIVFFFFYKKCFFFFFFSFLKWDVDFCLSCCHIRSFNAAWPSKPFFIQRKLVSKYERLFLRIGYLNAICMGFMVVRTFFCWTLVQVSLSYMSPLSSKSALTLAGFQHMLKCQVGLKNSLSLCAPCFLTETKCAWKIILIF